MMKKFLTFNEAADYLGLSEEEFRQISDKGGISPYRIGGVYSRFRVDELDAYRNRNLRKFGKSYSAGLGDRIRDFFYFNDFYVLSFIIIAVILYFIFK